MKYRTQRRGEQKNPYYDYWKKWRLWLYFNRLKFISVTLLAQPTWKRTIYTSKVIAQPKVKHYSKYMGSLELCSRLKYNSALCCFMLNSVGVPYSSRINKWFAALNSWNFELRLILLQASKHGVLYSKIKSTQMLQLELTEPWSKHVIHSCSALNHVT